MTRAEAAPRLGFASAASLKTVMGTQRARWPAPVACALPTRALLWDWPDLAAVAYGPRPAGRSRRADAADDDGLVTCLTCGRRFRSLGPHLSRAHQLTATQYRTEHGLPASATLMAHASRETLSEARHAEMAADPDRLAPMRAATPPLDELARRSASVRAATDNLPAVQHARRLSAQANNPAAQAARRAAMLARVQEAGYASIEDAVHRTAHLSRNAAAEKIGVGRTTITRWRVRYPST
ncbi:MucR family transcriptional regulator [Nocardia sp. NPDC059239]|uniref:MucR family transcriptional regulator n=1 Tax=unclassified Nocardia TaxID=2637762 RepID=UPI0036CBC3FE